MHFRGKPMVTYSIDNLRPFCDEIILVTSNDAYKVFGLKTVSDIYQGAGPLGGLHAGLAASATDINICLPCDLPFLKIELIQFMLHMTKPGCCVVPSNPLPQPLVAIYPKSILAFAESHLQQRILKMTALLNHCQTIYLSAEQMAPYVNLHSFLNVNSPDDIKTTE